MIDDTRRLTGHLRLGTCQHTSGAPQPRRRGAGEKHGRYRSWLADEAEDYVQANRGEITRPTVAERRARLRPYLDATAFTEYRDLVDPVMRVSADGTLGWVICQVRAAGTSDGREFESVSAWIELYAKSEGEWRRVGNVSNRRP